MHSFVILCRFELHPASSVVQLAILPRSGNVLDRMCKKCRNLHISSPTKLLALVLSTTTIGSSGKEGLRLGKTEYVETGQGSILGTSPTESYSLGSEADAEKVLLPQSDYTKENNYVESSIAGSGQKAIWTWPTRYWASEGSPRKSS